MRERLIELIKYFHCHPEKICNFDCYNCKPDEKGICYCFAKEADYLLENGVVVLPCKINDHVWFIKSAFSVLAKPFEARIIDIRGMSIDNNILYEAITLYNDLPRRFTSNDIGTKVFLTKEEAEKAIERSKKNEKFEKLE